MARAICHALLDTYLRVYQPPRALFGRATRAAVGGIFCSSSSCFIIFVDRVLKVIGLTGSAPLNDGNWNNCECFSMFSNHIIFVPLIFILVGNRPPCQGVEFATLEYWVRLRVPMDQAIRLYRVSVPIIWMFWFFFSQFYSLQFSYQKMFISALGTYQGTGLYEFRSI